MPTASVRASGVMTDVVVTARPVAPIWVATFASMVVCELAVSVAV